MQQIASGKERNYLFDNMKVLLTFFMVSAHYIRISGSFDVSSFGGFFYIIAFSFIMQGFLFVSGYFSKNVDKCRLGATKNFLLPYILLMPVMFVVRLGVFGDAKFDLLSPSHALWFLLVLFVYRFMIKDLEKVPGILILSAGLLLASGCFSSLGRELALGRICSFLFFFILGYKMKWEHIEKIRSISKKWILLLLSVLLVFSFLTAYSNVIPVEMWHLKDGYSIYHLSNIMGILIRMMLAVVSVGWLTVLLNLLPNHKIFCTGIGQRTMTVYICHIPIRYLIEHIDLPGDGNVLTYILSFGLAIASVYAFSRPALHTAYHAIIDFLYDKICARVFAFGNMICDRTLNRGHKMIRKVYRNR